MRCTMRLFAFALAVSIMLCSCAFASEKLSVVCTNFPCYDFARAVLGDTADIRLLIKPGAESHSYEPTPMDIIAIQKCDVFICVGGENDTWAQKILSGLDTSGMQIVRLMEIVEPCVSEHHHADEEGHEDHEGHAHEYDEHVWLSLRNAKVLCRAIADELAEIDTENADTYQENEKAYVDKLDELDKKYQETVDSASQKTLLFGDRFPFRYMVDDYGLSYYAAFVGCSAETEASFETITFLAGKTDELGLKNIMTIEKSDQKIAKTIIENTKEKNQGILTLDSMQSTTSDDVKKGATYFSIMESNLSVLQEALQ